MVLKVVIVEDEKNSFIALNQLLVEFCDDIQVLGHATTVEEAISLIEASKPDLVFLDVELHSGTGFDILTAFEKPGFDVIFTTAFEHYAIKAIKFSSIDYLLKPINLDDLQSALTKTREGKNTQLYLSKIENLVANIQGDNLRE